MTSVGAATGPPADTARAAVVAGAAGGVLLTLGMAQFLMTLDTSVMNVSIADVAADVGSSVAGIQTAITLYALVMASLMVTGGKIGSIIGRRRAFSIGCVVYGLGSFTTSIAPNLAVLLIGWSLFEGMGAALIMPAIVGLIAANVEPDGRPRAYGLMAAAGAIAVAAGPLIGGLVTTYASWRWVFASEVLVVVVILAYARRIHDEPVAGHASLDLVGTVLSASGLGLAVYGVLRSSEWGWVAPKSEDTAWLGLSPTIWLILAGVTVIHVFTRWEAAVVRRGEEPLVQPGVLGNDRLRGGLTLFFFQFLVQGGLFFIVPLYLSVALGLSAAQTGVRLVPLSLTLIATATAVPKFFPHASPRRVVQSGLLGLMVGVVSLLAGLELGSGPEITTVPMLLAGVGIGALVSQLGAVTVSALPDERSAEVGGLQNTASNLGLSIGTALVGAVLMASLTGSFLTGIVENPAIPQALSEQAEVELTTGVPFVSDDDLEGALTKAGVDPDVIPEVVDENEEARIVALRVSLAVLVLFVLIALWFTKGIPTVQPADELTGTAPPGHPKVGRASRPLGADRR